MSWKVIQIRDIESEYCLQKEAARVEQEGGYIVFVQGEMRVNGVLNITRSLGWFNQEKNIEQGFPRSV